MNKVLIVICAALGNESFKRCAKADFWDVLDCRAIDTVFPALTCPFQATLRTGLTPEKHGIIANGFFHREFRKSFFWEQSSNLYRGERFWDEFRKKGGRVGQICLQQSLGNDSDLIISPAPIHKHHGGMIQNCYSKPADLYSRICRETGKNFSLYDYWGPFTSIKATKWISSAAIFAIKEQLCDLLLVYLPHLDYDLQRFGPESKEEEKAFRELETELDAILHVAGKRGYEIIIIGDYAIEHAIEVIYPNKVLRESGFFNFRDIKGMLYPDFYSSTAFAICDHQIALIYLEDHSRKNELKKLLTLIPGLAEIIDLTGGNNPDMILKAKHGYWFSYRWWNDPAEAPDYANHVDIHNKPGFDPCELFMSFWPPPFSISQDDSKVRGTHGISDGEKSKILLATTVNLTEVNSIIELPDKLKQLF